MEEKDSMNSPEEQPISTLPTNLKVSLRGFADEEAAKRVGDHLGGIAYEIGRYFDLSILDGITVAYDYENAISELDRGVEDLKPLEPSKEHAFGVAMTPTIIRDGKVKVYIIIHASMVESFPDLNHPDYKDAFYTLVHELMHAHDKAAMNRAFPNTILKKVLKAPLDFTFMRFLRVVGQNMPLVGLVLGFTLSKSKNLKKSSALL